MTSSQHQRSDEAHVKPSHAPRISAKVWREITSLADDMDAAARANDPKISIACELRFAAAKNTKDPEWTDAVNGPTKKRFARALIRRFKTRFARKGIIYSTKNKHHSQQTPLWELSLYWRLDQKALVIKTPEVSDTQSEDPNEPSENDANKPPLEADNPGLQVLSIMPEKGCLCVRLPMTKTCKQLSAITSGLYKQAIECGLTSEVHQSSHRGLQCPIYVADSDTVRGDHQDSFFLQKPEYLARIITYWQNHPCLSYLFASSNIGPFGDHPRTDEIRFDALYELEIALEKLQSESASEFFSDELRTLLVPLLTRFQGSDEFAEISLNDLFAIDDTGSKIPRAIKLSSFGMGTDDRMILLQLMFIRAIMTRLKTHAFRKPLIRWQQKLQNEFTLPYFLYQDFIKVLQDLKAYGHTFDENWFAPHFLKRFPKYGRVVLDDVELELSRALEPQNAHSRESAKTRSKNQRLQLLIKAFDQDRHILTCNDMELSLAETQSPGVFVTAFRLEQKPHSLGTSRATALSFDHNTTHDLTVELIDREKEKSLGGFFFKRQPTHASKWPHKETLYNEQNLKSNCTFIPFAPHSGKVTYRSPPSSSEYPHMLDLRRI